MTAQATGYQESVITTASRATQPEHNGTTPYTPSEDTQGPGPPAYVENAPEQVIQPGK